jgi:hypothetical protein
MQAINFDQNYAPHWGRAQGKPVPYRAARDPTGAKYFSREAGARSAIGHCMVSATLFLLK